MPFVVYRDDFLCFEVIDLNRDDLELQGRTAADLHQGRTVPFSDIFEGADPRIHVGPPTRVAHECLPAPARTPEAERRGVIRQAKMERRRHNRGLGIIACRVNLAALPPV